MFDRAFKGFRDFIMRGNVIDLAVAVVIGTAFNTVVQSLVKDLLTPLIAAIFGKPDFNGMVFTIHHSTFHFGSFINAVISFLFVAAAVYYFVVLPVNVIHDRRRRGDADTPAPSDEVVLLTQIRDVLQRGGARPAGDQYPGSQYAGSEYAGAPPNPPAGRPAPGTPGSAYPPVARHGDRGDRATPGS